MDRSWPREPRRAHVTRGSGRLGALRTGPLLQEKIVLPSCEQARPVALRRHVRMGDAAPGARAGLVDIAVAAGGSPFGLPSTWRY